MIDIKDLEKGAVLKALFDASKQQGMGALDPNGRDSISLSDATEIVQARTRVDGYPSPVCRFDYLRGRVLKVDIGGDAFDPSLYDRDNGQGAARRAINALRQGTGAGAPTKPVPTYKDSLLAVMQFVHKMSVEHPEPAVREEATTIEVDFIIGALTSLGKGQ